MNIKKRFSILVLFISTISTNTVANLYAIKNHGKLIYRPELASNRLMNIFYQNCHASSLPNYDFIKTGELLGFSAEFNSDTNGKVSKIINLEAAKKLKYLNCQSDTSTICQNPPSYLWGGKGIYHTDKKEVDIFHNNDIVELKAKHPGLDCSGFVNLSFILAGLKVDQNISHTIAADEISAKEFMKPLSCFKEIKIELGEEIQPGDIIAWNKHIVMIDKVGSNPFGINQITNPEGCDLRKLKPQSAKMTVLNSKGANDPISAKDLELSKFNPHLFRNLELASQKLTGIGPGIIKSDLGQLTFTNPEDVMDLIQTACLAKFKLKLPSRKIKVVRHILADNQYNQNDLKNCTIPKNEIPSFIGNDLKCN